MGVKLSGIAINQITDNTKFLKELNVHEDDIVNKETINFDDLESDFTDDKNIAFCKTKIGTFIFCHTDIVCDDVFLKKISQNCKVISFYCYDTTSTYCIDIFEKGEHITHLWLSDDESFGVIDENFGFDSNLNDTNKVSDFIYKQIESISNISFSTKDLKRKCEFYDYKPEDYLSIPLKKQEVENYIFKRISPKFEQEKFKFIKSWGYFKKRNKTCEFMFAMGCLSETLIDRNWGVRFEPRLDITCKKLSKTLIENGLKDNIVFLSIDLLDLLSDKEEKKYTKFSLSSKDDVDNCVKLILENFETKIDSFFNKFPDDKSIIDFYMAADTTLNHKYMQSNSFNVAIPIAKLCKNEKLVHQLTIEKEKRAIREKERLKEYERKKKPFILIQ